MGRRAIYSRQELASTSFFFLRARASYALEWALTAAPALAVGRRAIYSSSLLAAAGAAGCIAAACRRMRASNVLEHRRHMLRCLFKEHVSYMDLTEASVASASFKSMGVLRS